MTDIDALVAKLNVAADDGDELAANIVRNARSAGIAVGIAEHRTVKWEQSHVIREAATTLTALSDEIAVLKEREGDIVFVLDEIAEADWPSVDGDDPVLRIKGLARRTLSTLTDKAGGETSCQNCGASCPGCMGEIG